MVKCASCPVVRNRAQRPWNTLGIPHKPVPSERQREEERRGFLASSEAEEKAEAPRFRKRLCFEGIGREKQKTKWLFWPLSVYMNVNPCIRSMNLRMYTYSRRYTCNTHKYANLKQQNNNNSSNKTVLRVCRDDSVFQNTRCSCG